MTHSAAPPTIDEYRDLLSRTPAHAQYIASGTVKRPAISIITTVLNGSSTIRSTIEGVMKQGSKDLEYIIVDAGSSDRTLDVISEYREVVSYCLSERDGGISDGFNKGVALSHGDIIGIINADDYYLEGAVGRAAAKLTDPSLGFVHGGCAFTVDGVEMFSRPADTKFEERFRRGLPGIFHPTMFVRRSVYERFGMFRTNLRFAMDFDFMLRLWRNGVKGGCCEERIAKMALGGVSSRQCFASFREARAIASDHGVKVSAVRGYLNALYTVARNRWAMRGR